MDCLRGQRRRPGQPGRFFPRPAGGADPGGALGRDRLSDFSGRLVTLGHLWAGLFGLGGADWAGLCGGVVVG